MKYKLIQIGGNKKKWTVFRHNGPMFPQQYQKHNINDDFI